MSRARRLAGAIDEVITKTASFTVSPADWGKRFDCAHASTLIEVTLPSDADATIPINTSSEFLRAGAARVAFIPAGDVDLDYDTTAGLESRETFTSVIVTKTGANRFLIRGDIVASP